ncbi:50S ribosomal protein L3 [Candidatus Dojkabacteria bacterium]|nr:50S ribosomal protein L3 [Candidatus Dojkabacteria bacterium]
MKIIGKKKIMTQIFKDTGEVVPVTVIACENLVIARKEDDKVYVGLGKKKKANKAEKGKYSSLGFVPQKVVMTKYEGFKDKKVGDNIDLDILDEVKKVDVRSISKGKGFAGVVKRWGFSGGPKTHGQSDRLRAPGSIGAGTDPARVFPGKKMPGRLGGKIVTVKNLEVVKIDHKNNLIFVKGGVPGVKNAIVEINIKDI